MRAPAIGVDADIGSAQLHGAGDGERERRAAEFGRVDAEEQVVHDRIADEDQIEDVVAIDLRFGADLADQSVDRIAHRLGHRLAAVRVHHHVGDAAHQIFAEADLRVRRAGRGEPPARQQRHQMHGDGGRADVAGNALGLVLQARPQRDDAPGVAQS